MNSATADTFVMLIGHSVASKVSAKYGICMPNANLACRVIPTVEGRGSRDHISGYFTVLATD